MKKVKEDSPLMVLVNLGNYLTVNKHLAEIFNYGYTESIVFAFLCSEQDYYIKHNKLNSKGMFYCTENTMKENLGYDRRTQRKAIKNLKEFGLIDYNIQVGKKRFFRVKTEKIEELLDIKSISKYDT